MKIDLSCLGMIQVCIPGTLRGEGRSNRASSKANQTATIHCGPTRCHFTRLTSTNLTFAAVGCIEQSGGEHFEASHVRDKTSDWKLTVITEHRFS